MKRKVTISIKDGEYNVEFLRADGSKKSEWRYYSLPNAESDISDWLADDSQVPD